MIKIFQILVVNVPLVLSTSGVSLACTEVQITDSEAQKQKTGKTAEEALQSLNRDVANANQKLEKQDLQALQERQEMAQVIGELSQAGINHLVGDKLKEADKKRQEADAIEKENPEKATALRAQAQAIEAEYGLGSNLQMGIRAATTALQGLATGNVNQAAVGAVSPYLNKLIKEQTGDNKEANLIAHAVLGAVEAHVTGNNAAAGALGALTAEVAAPLIMQTLYGTEKPENLTDSQKQNVANLSQIAAGLSGGLIGNSTGSFVAGAEIGKRAVENNAVNKNDAGDKATLLNMLNNSPSKVGLLKGEEASQKLLDFNNTGDISELYTPNQVAYFNTQKGRYIYTEKGGWIDMVHFLFYAGEAYEEKLKLQKEGLSLKESQDRAYAKSIFLSWKQENVFDAWFARHSSFSYEDLPSDRYGADFGSRYFDKNSGLSLGEQILNYLHDLKPAKPEEAPNYHNLPSKDNGKHPGVYNRTIKPIYTKEKDSD